MQSNLQASRRGVSSKRVLNRQRATTGGTGSWLNHDEQTLFTTIGIAHPVQSSAGGLLLSITLVVLSHQGERRQGPRPLTKSAAVSADAPTGVFRMYPLPRAESEAMRPALDHLGRLCFGVMGLHALVVFDPRTQLFHSLTPPGGQHSITGVLVAPDDTIWQRGISSALPSRGSRLLIPANQATSNRCRADPMNWSSNRKGTSGSPNRGPIGSAALIRQPGRFDC